MDLLDFEGRDLYFDEPLAPAVEGLLHQASESYGDGEAEPHLLRAYFLAPEHLSVIVALYRYYYYQHRYDDALLVANRALAITSLRLGLTGDWRDLTPAVTEAVPEGNRVMLRFHLLALKGAGFLNLRRADPKAALACLKKVRELDPVDRLNTAGLIDIAKEALSVVRKPAAA